MAFLLLGAIWSRPMHRYFFTGIPYEVGPQPEVEVVTLTPHDSLQLYYKFWLTTETLLGRIPLFANPYEFALPGARGFTSQQVPVSLLFAALSVLSPIFAYNTIIWLSFLGCGLGMMFLARRVTGDAAAAFVGGIVFALMPFRLPQLYAGHPNGYAVAFLPFIFLLSEIALGRTRRRAWAAVGGGLMFSAIAMLDLQLAFFSAILVAGYLPLRALAFWCLARPGASVKSRLADLTVWLGGLAVGVVPGALYLLVIKLAVLPRSAIHGGGAVTPGTIARLADLFDMTVAGERRIYLGPWAAGMVIAGVLLPWFLLAGKRRLHQGLTALGCFVAALGGIILSLAYSPELSPWLGRLPILRLSRTPARATVITFMATALLVATALACLRRAWRGRRGGLLGRRAAWILGAAVFLHDYWLPGPRGINLLPRKSPAFEAAVADAPRTRILAVPLWPGDSSWSAHLLYHVTLSRAHIINGYSPVASAAYRDQIFVPLQAVNVGQFGASEWRRAKAFGVTHVTFHPEAFPAPQWVSVFPASVTRDGLLASPYLEGILHADPIDLFRVLPEPAPDERPAASSPIGISVPGAHGRQPGSAMIQDADSVMGTVLAGTGVPDAPRCLFSNRGRVYPPGDYRVLCRATVAPLDARTAETAGSVVLKAVDTNGDTLLAEHRIVMDPAGAGNYAWFKLPLALPSAARVRFEAWAEGNARLRLDLWHMTFADRVDGERIEAEACFHVGRVVADSLASGRGYVQTDARDPHRFIVRGPYRFLPGGRYALRARLHFDARGGGGRPELAVAAQLRPDAAPQAVFVEAPLDVAPAAGFVETETLFEVPMPGAIVEATFHRPRTAVLNLDWFSFEPRP